MPKNYFWIIIFLIITLTYSCSKKTSKIEIPIAKKGVLDIRGWNFEKNGSIQLKGEWEMYWNKLYTPEDFKNNTLDQKPY